jgi:hypothetical protein
MPTSYYYGHRKGRLASFSASSSDGNGPISPSSFIEDNEHQNQALPFAITLKLGPGGELGMSRVREHMLEQFENTHSKDQAQNDVQFSADTAQHRTLSALDLVSQVANIIRGLQERAAETEARARALAESALERLRQAETRINDAETARARRRHIGEARRAAAGDGTRIGARSGARRRCGKKARRCRAPAAQCRGAGDPSGKGRDPDRRRHSDSATRRAAKSDERPSDRRLKIEPRWGHASGGWVSKKVF